MLYRAEIDGLRALAVLPVVLYHIGIGSLSGGFVGVDIFFVISGYLITSIILNEIQAGSFSITSFYERRVRRILPALYLVVLACLPIALIVLTPDDLKIFSQSLISIPIFVSNIYFSKHAGYFDSKVGLNPLLHTWSLSIEEQFYLWFPVFLLLGFKYGKPLVMAMLVLLIASFVNAQIGSLDNPVVNFYLFKSRCWEFLAGALAAFYLVKENVNPSSQSLKIEKTMGIVGLLLIVVPMFIYNRDTPFPSYYALAPVMGTCLIIIFANQPTTVAKFLSTKLLVGIGLISYSLYLWHQPLIAFARYRSETYLLSSFLKISIFFITLFLSYLTWRFVEMPFRNRELFDKSKIFIMAAIGGLLLLTVGVITYQENGFENFYKKYRLNDSQRVVYSMLQTYSDGDMYKEMSDDNDCNFWSRVVDIKFKVRFLECAKKYGQATIVLGDSHAMNIYNSLQKSKLGKFIVSVSVGGCRPHNNYPGCPYDDFNKFVAENKKSIKSILFHQSGSYLLENKDGYIDQLGKMYDTNYKLNVENTKKTSDYLNGLSKTVPVIWLGPFVEARANNFRVIMLNDFDPKAMRIKKNSITVFEYLDLNLQSYLSERGYEFQYISLVKILEIDEGSLIIDNCLTFRNDDHFSSCGEMVFGNKIKSYFELHQLP